MEESTEAPSRKRLAVWQQHWQDESDAAFLYHMLAEAESQPEHKNLYGRFATIEERHANLWQQLLEEQGVDVDVPTPSLRVHILTWISRRFGVSLLLPLIIREESREVKVYLALHRESVISAAKQTALTLAKESAEHAEALSQLAGTDGEPWHRTASAGVLNHIVYGFNDGLTANFGLVAGVIGAHVEPGIIMATGLVGLIADALSMGSSSYLAAKSEQEVYEYEIDMEEEEIRLMPEVEEDELALMYERRGIQKPQARQMAQNLMCSPKQALDEQIREELGIGQPNTTPVKQGWITGTATAIGALIPVAPFFFLQGSAAIWTAFCLAMLSHFAVGAARSIFTGRALIRSGIDMFLVGLGVAGAAFIIGELISQWLL